ncbi:MAG: hypothetical protein KAJ76_09460 [Candidatus Heimdallarchaeota archaeon]|nr:hypothetical protein [Candidatus Heimdallarchaeota archaeon]
MIPATNVIEYAIFTFDEFRSNLQETLTKLDNQIKLLMVKEEEGDSIAKAYLYLYRGIHSIITAERKYRAGDYNAAANEFGEGGKSISRFQRMSTGFAIEFQQEAERLDMYSKGRLSECQALKKGTRLEEQITNLIEAVNSYTLELEIVGKSKKILLIYNANARANFVQGLVYRLQGQKAQAGKDYQLAKRKHLNAYRAFVTAAYYNPSYSIWVEEQNKTIKSTLNKLINDKAAKEWGRAFKLAGEGKFTESSVKCKLASKLYLRASELATEDRESLILYAYSHMLKASMFEANANEFLKNKNDAKSAVRQFELATIEMREAIDNYPKGDEDTNVVKRWGAQLNYYQGYFHQAEGIFNLDEEKFDEALVLFNQANEAFQNGLKEAVESRDEDLKSLLEKSLAEANGYIGMCKTVLD